jgi:hypothetical protein
MTEQGKFPQFSRGFTRAFIVLLLATGLCLALLALMDRSTGFELSIFLNNEWLWAAIPLQLTGLGLFVLAWYLLLNYGSRVSVSWNEAAAHIGITLVGKYLPGKVWGLLGRSYLLTRKGATTQDAAELLLADQFLTFYSGLLLGALALVLVLSYPAGLVLLLVGIVSIPAVLNSYAHIMSWLLQIARRLFTKLAEKISAYSPPEQFHSLGLPFLVYLTHWLVISSVLCVLFLPSISTDVLVNSLLVIAAIPLGMLAGFLALWAPGGIGVREAVITGILAINLDLEIAASVAITYRLICIANDLLMGFAALFYYRRGLPEESRA